MYDISKFWEKLEYEKTRSYIGLNHAYLFELPYFYDFDEEIDKIISFVKEENSHLHDIKTYSGKQFVIEEVRNLEKFFSFEAFDNFKIAIIKNIEDAPHTSLESILKILEEPPSKSLFLITTSNSFKLPQTILSRVQKVSVESNSNEYSEPYEEFKSLYPLLYKELDEEVINEFEKTHSISRSMQKNKTQLAYMSFIHKYKDNKGALLLSLFYFYFLLQKRMYSASIHEPHYAGLIKLNKIVEEIFNQKDILSHHHFEYIWYASSRLNV